MTDAGDERGDEAVTEPKAITKNEIPRWKEVGVVGPSIDAMSETERALEVLANV